MAPSHPPSPASADPVPADAELVLDAGQQGLLEVLAGGGLAPLHGWMGAADLQACLATGTLADGTPWLTPVVLGIPADAAREIVGRATVLRDEEGVALGTMAVASATPLPGGRAALHGDLTVLALPTHHDHPDLRQQPSALAAAASGTVLVVPSSRPLTRADREHLATLAGGTVPTRLLLQSWIGPAPVDDPRPHTVVRAHRLVVDRLRDAGHDVTHVIVPLAHPAADDAEGWHLAAVLARNSGGDVLLCSAEEPVRQAVADVVPSVLPWQPARLGPDEEAPVPGGRRLHVWDEDVAALLDRRDPPPSRQGVTVLLTGLSGSGKSTVARAVMARIHAETDRRVTLLDGDRVRHHLSSELGFSREHRDLNVTRIGFVAAEVTKHGGIALCAPIAPYASTRLAVRRLVEAAGTFLLVHVSTPLEVCEARDRKGLYARARAGEIAAFTGISDPYETPEDADLRLDTSRISVGAAAQAVMDLLTDRGFLPRTAPGTGGRGGAGGTTR